MKILTIIGARPQFIKAASISRKIQEYNDIKEVILHTGQHYDKNMSKLFFDELGIKKPKYNLNIISDRHGEQTGKMLIGIEEVITDESPDWVLVYGDTNSTLAGALSASKIHVPIAHVEAGLRSFNKKMPEEINRVITDHVSEALFTPTKIATNNLIAEGIANHRIIEVGDVMYDVTLLFSDIAQNQSKIFKKINRGKDYILCTIHRAENTDNPTRLLKIFDQLEIVSSKYPVVIPLHPRTKNKLKSIKFDFSCSNIQFIEPVGYLDMLNLEKNSLLIITDSGGIQKEAYFHQIPCITLRQETEWQELVEAGYNKLALNDNTPLIDILDQMIQLNFKNDIKFYGDGNSAEKIINNIVAWKND